MPSDLSKLINSTSNAEESPDDFYKNHQFKLDAHLVM